MFTIYVHTHRASGKQYVGQTRKTMHKRWVAHVNGAKTRKWCAGRTHFANAIRRHGPEAFDHAVLEVVATVEEANAAEAAWIARLNRHPRHVLLLCAAAARGHGITERDKAMVARWVLR